MAALLKFWPLVALALQLLTVWVCWSLRQLAHAEVKSLVDTAFNSLKAKDVEIEKDVDKHGDRILTVEGRVDALDKVVASLPTKADLNRVEGELRTEIRGVGVDASATKAGVDRLEGYFLERGVGRVG